MRSRNNHLKKTISFSVSKTPFFTPSTSLFRTASATFHKIDHLILTRHAASDTLQKFKKLWRGEEKNPNAIAPSNEDSNLSKSAIETESSSTRIDTFVIPEEKLKSGYKKLHERFNDLLDQIKFFSITSPMCAGAWLVFTQQMLLESPVGMAILVGGIGIVAERARQARSVNRYTRLSVMSAESGPSTSEDENQKSLAIMGGPRPNIKFNREGLKISGPSGNHNLRARSEALDDIRALNRIVIPSCTLSATGTHLTSFAYERWLVRFTVPFSIINLVTTLSKKNKDRRIDDYVVLAAAIENIWNFLTGSSVGEARQKFTDALLNCKTSKEVMDILIEHDILEEGGMSFLNKWLEQHAGPISLRLGRTGSLVVYPGEKNSIGGPYPARLFPLPTKIEDASEKEENKKSPESHSAVQKRSPK